MRTLLVSLTLVALFSAGAVFAQTDTATTTVAEGETVTTADLGIEDPGLLPTSRIYFFKEFRRGLERLFTFNAVSRARLELRISNEKAAETKKVEETSPQNAEAVTKAIQNYRQAQERLRARFEALRETSQNPNVDRLLEQFAEHAVRHEKLFDELAKKFEGRVEVEAAAERAKERVEEALAKAAEKDDPAKFAARLEKALVDVKGSELKHVRSVEILERISDNAPAELRERLERLRQDFAERLKEDVEALVKEDAEKVRDILERLPGERARHAVIIEEIRARAEARVREALEDVGEFLEKAVEEEGEFVDKVREQIEDATKRVQKLEVRLAETVSPPAVARNLFEEARRHLERAEAAFAEQKYGEAFGMVRSAEVLARNGLRILEEFEEEEEAEAEDFEEDLEELAIKIEKYEALLQERGLTRDKHPQAWKLLENAKTHLGFARDALAKDDLAGTKLHIGHVRGFLRDLIRLIEAEIRKTALPTEKPVPVEAIACPAVSLPACERDRRSEECVRQVRELVAKYPRCGFEKFLREQEEKMEALRECGPRPGAPGNWICQDGKWTLEKPGDVAFMCFAQGQNPVCGVDGKTYSNECFARAAGVAVRSKGECVAPSKEPEPSAAPAPTTAAEPAPSVSEFKLEADDRGFYPDATVKVRKGLKVKLTFVVRTEFVYFGGLDFRSRKFETPAVKPGDSTTVEFVADESFDFYSYWPASNALKATGKVIVE